MSTLAAPSSIPPLRQDAAVIGLVGLAHGVSHFSQLLLPPLFPWLKDAFAVSYTQLGLLLTIFFVVSCAVQTLSGFVVDRFGPRPVLMAGLALIGLAATGYALAPSYAALALCAVVAGIGNGVFHPVDYTLLNAKVHKSRLGHAYSVHGITGSLGWALAPALMVPVAMAAGWRTALFAGALSVVQTYAPEAARQLHGVPVHLAAMCLSVYMVCSAAGMVAGGFLATDPARCERIVGIGFGIAAGVALLLALGHVAAFAVPVLFGVMGGAAGIAGPSRDLLVKRSTPDGATGRVYGVVYSGLDIGQAITPLVFGAMMDGHVYQGVLVGLAALQLVLIASAFNVRRVARPAAQPASA